MEALADRGQYLIAKEYGQSPASVRRWSDYDFCQALLFLQAENGGGAVTEDEIQENITARLKGKEGDVAILEHTPSYWTERTREQVNTEGYNADYVAEELAALGLALAGEAVPVDKPKKKGRKVADDTVDDVRDLDTTPLENTED